MKALISDRHVQILFSASVSVLLFSYSYKLLIAVHHFCSAHMRPLTEEESKTLFTKLANYIGKNLVHLIDRSDEPYCFRLHKDRVYYVSESSMRLAISVAKPNLVSLGTCFGKFSKSGKFKLHITALDYLAQYAKYKVWVKPNGEMPFLYGNHVLKAHLGRITEDTPEHQGVIVYSMNDVPLGFGVTARSTVDTRKLDPTAIIVFHQADVGEYLRDETPKGIMFAILDRLCWIYVYISLQSVLLPVSFCIYESRKVANASVAKRRAPCADRVAAMSSPTPDLCIRWTQLKNHEITSETIRSCLTPITDDLWVAAACVDRLVDDCEAQRSLLDLGIRRTETAMRRVQAYVENASLADSDDEVESSGSPAKKERLESAALTTYFQSESADGRLCHLRCVLLDRLDRLNSFVEICKQVHNESRVNDGDEWEDDPWEDSTDAAEETATASSTELPLSLPSFLTEDFVDIAYLLASTTCLSGLRVLMARHASSLWPYRFTILEHIPDYVPAATFRDLLPALDSATNVEKVPESCPWRSLPDWTEKPVVRHVLQSLTDWPSPVGSEYAGDPCSGPLPFTQLTSWYHRRIEDIITTTGMIDNALSLVQHAASQGIPELDQLGEDLLLFSRLVYDAAPKNSDVAAKDWTFDGWKSLDAPATLRAYLANSPTESIAQDIIRLVMPFLFILEARAERAGRPDPDLPRRMLYDYILQAPLDIVAAIFEASKPTLPLSQRIIQSDEDMARLALACLYGSDSLDEWPTMSRIFECLPAWNVSEGDDEADEADTTIVSLGAFVAPSTTRPTSTPTDLLLFFKPLPPSSLSRALDVLDVHLESGEILARWSVAAPLRWFLQSNSDLSEQRAWANKMARRAGGTEDKLETQEDWEWLLEDMLKLARSSLKGAFCLLSTEEVSRIFFSGLLAAGRFDIAKKILYKPASGLQLGSTSIEDICLACSQEFYDNASSGNYHFGDMKLAYDCLDVPPPSERIRREKDFIEATSRLCAFNLTSRPGIPISPIEIRLTKDRLSLVSRVLASNPEAYKHTQMILELVHKLGFVNDVVAEVKTLAMLADTAVNAEDFSRAYESAGKMIDMVATLKSLKSTDDPELERAIDVCWVSCFQLGRHPDFEETDKKLSVLGHAMEICPADKIVDVLPAWRREESNDLEARRRSLASRQGDKIGVNGSAKPTSNQALSPSSLTERLHKLHLPTSPLVHAPDAAALANKAFHSVAANFPFSVGTRGRSHLSEDSDRSRSGSGSRPRYDGADVSAQATRVLQKGLGWLLGDDD
ncbi:hypothetical protein NM688_g875 [Phlebia brevispora]|uniref:Uncharacterized protein n=1 Tax=Phlebia brevispora TaxID=194682 RepID=A0ACC1TCY8_9APHY|nr:hypothetical protein NM688_g875 [Phlebia brevispora]